MLSVCWSGQTSTLTTSLCNLARHRCGTPDDDKEITKYVEVQIILKLYTFVTLIVHLLVIIKQ
jgi:hypothetical protein